MSSAPKSNPKDKLSTHARLSKSLMNDMAACNRIPRSIANAQAVQRMDAIDI